MLNKVLFPHSEITWKNPSFVYFINQRLDISVFILSYYEHDKCLCKNSNDSEKYRKKFRISQRYQIH